MSVLPCGMVRVQARQSMIGRFSVVAVEEHVSHKSVLYPFLGFE